MKTGRMEVTCYPADALQEGNKFDEKLGILVHSKAKTDKHIQNDLDRFFMNLDQAIEDINKNKASSPKL